jgi:hypothetical protein
MIAGGIRDDPTQRPGRAIHPTPVTHPRQRGAAQGRSPNPASRPRVPHLPGRLDTFASKCSGAPFGNPNFHDDPEHRGSAFPDRTVLARRTVDVRTDVIVMSTLPLMITSARGPDFSSCAEVLTTTVNSARTIAVRMAIRRCRGMSNPFRLEWTRWDRRTEPPPTRGRAARVPVGAGSVRRPLAFHFTWTHSEFNRPARRSGARRLSGKILRGCRARRGGRPPRRRRTRSGPGAPLSSPRRGAGRGSPPPGAAPSTST